MTQGKKGSAYLRVPPDLGVKEVEAGIDFVGCVDVEAVPQLITSKLTVIRIAKMINSFFIVPPINLI